MPHPPSTNRTKGSSLPPPKNGGGPHPRSQEPRPGGFRAGSTRTLPWWRRGGTLGTQSPVEDPSTLKHRPDSSTDLPSSGEATGWSRKCGVPFCSGRRFWVSTLHLRTVRRRPSLLGGQKGDSVTPFRPVGSDPRSREGGTPEPVPEASRHTPTLPEPSWTSSSFETPVKR